MAREQKKFSTDCHEGAEVTNIGHNKGVTGGTRGPGDGQGAAGVGQGAAGAGQVLLGIY